MNKVTEYIIAGLAGGIFFGLVFSSFPVAMIAFIWSMIWFYNFCKESDEDSRRFQLEKKKIEEESKIEEKKYRSQLRLERKKRKEWEDEINALYPH